MQLHGIQNNKSVKLFIENISKNIRKDFLKPGSKTIQGITEILVER